jgi:hypothetical protein
MNRCGRTSIKLNRYRAATRAQQLGASFRHETAVTALVTDADRLVGARWRQLGESGTARAAATVLAAGGFIMTEAMMAQYLPQLTTAPMALGSTYDDGLAIRLGMSAGGDTSHMDELFIGDDRQQKWTTLCRRGLLALPHIGIRHGTTRLRGLIDRRRGAPGDAGDPPRAMENALGIPAGNFGHLPREFQQSFTNNLNSLLHKIRRHAERLICPSAKLRMRPIYLGRTANFGQRPNLRVPRASMMARASSS